MVKYKVLLKSCVVIGFISIILTSCAGQTNTTPNDLENENNTSENSVNLTKDAEAIDQADDSIVDSSEWLGDNSETIESGELEMSKDEDALSLSNGNDNEKKNNRDSTENDCQIYLFSEFEEISRDQYINDYGERSLTEHPITAIAKRIGRVDFNQAALSPGFLKTGDKLRLSLFGETVYYVSIDSVTKGVYSSFTGYIVGSETGHFMLTASDNKVLATLEMYSDNAIYLIRYNAVSARHYIYLSSMDTVEKLPD